MPNFIGGSFAPPLDLQKLTTYRELAKSADGPTRDAMLELCEMVEVFQQTPKSKQGSKPHPSGRGTITPLNDAEVNRIWDVVPWDHEIEGMRSLFDAIPAESPLRTPAFHLLWFAIELAKDREPLTNDKL